MPSCKATWSLSDNSWAWARLPSASGHELITKGNSSSEGHGAWLALPGVTQQDKDCWARSRQQISLLVSTNHPALQNQATWSTSVCKMPQSSVARAPGGDVSLRRCYVTKTEMFPFAPQSSGNCTLTVFLPSSRAFCLPHPSGKAPRLAWAVLQQAVECFFRDLSLGQGSWVLQQWNSLSPWLATPLGTAPHLALTKANTAVQRQTQGLPFDFVIIVLRW